MKIELKLMKDAAEIVQSYLPYTNIGIQKNRLSYFDGMKALCHWHDDIELVKIIDGEMNYYVNGKTYHLKKNDGIIVNSKAMHYGFSHHNRDCHFICVLISPYILGENSPIYHHFIFPIISSYHLDVCCLYEHNIQHQNILKNIEQFGAIYSEQIHHHQSIDLDCIAIACHFWKNWYNLIKEKIDNNPHEDVRELLLQKKMTQFIYQNYMHPLKLDNIASSANICRSKCCQLFKKYAQQSPISFLNEYRVEKAKEMLLNTSSRITDIAYSCGFNNLSYFSKQFYKVTQYTPKKYQQERLIDIKGLE
ncbi:helix-turn-helix domain-containing protein [Lonepinella sp. BR2930]|uniref:helix-turn-helix domain-containing protein n=1 Tax=Lonepinella sp. BR2930 TaxID=3434554 RepID=UPI003F6DEE76